MRTLFITTLALLLGACAEMSDSSGQGVEQLMQRYQGDVPGASLLVVRDGKPLIKRGYGMANMEKNIKAGPETNYRLASITKQFIAASILLLREDGKLHLQDPIRKWLPELPASDDAITIEQMLSHTSGMTDYEELIPEDQTEQVQDADVLRMMSTNHGSYFKPGSAYRYSNTAYVLLGLVIERISGDTLPAFLKQRIFAPLGMNETLLYEHHRGPGVAHRAYGYSFIDGTWKRTDQSLTSATRGDGGIYSSVNDLGKWDAALYDDRLLSDESRSLAFSPHAKVTGEPYEASYGFGWRITGDTLWHSGESMGFRNVIVRWPKQHFTIILLSNRNALEPYQTALAIAREFGVE